jgi:proton-dependent oligopeptide transporter, POT family
VNTPSSQAIPPGHPRGLSTLFFTEMWERFSYYGMRAILTPFMAAAVVDGGLGFNKSGSGAIYALYTAAVYMMALPGGWLADKFLGQKRAVFLGGLIIMVGHILLALPASISFYLGLVCLVIGTGFLKPNVSTMVGQLYPKGDPRRDAAFSIFYMGINVGGFASPIVCGWLAQTDTFKGWLVDMGISAHYSWHVAFGAAAVGMAFGLLQFWIGRANLDGVGEPPVITDPAEKAKNQKILIAIGAAVVGIPGILAGVHFGGSPLDKQTVSNIFGVLLLTVFVGTFVVLYSNAKTDRERNGIKAMVALAIGCVAFFALFEQAGSTMNAFADERTRTVAFGKAFPSAWFQSVNSVFIILLSPIFAWFFVWIVAKKYAFNDIKKFGAALIFMSFAFVVMLPAAGGKDVSPWYLMGFYFFSTVAELMLSPVGLSSMSKLAPPAAGGLVMGVWFLATSNGQYIAGRVHGLTGEFSESGIFTVIIIGGLLVAVVMFFFGSFFTRKIPLESLQNSPGKDDGTGVPPVVGGGRTITGYGVASLATALALWPVVLTDPQLGLAVTIILGTSALIMAFKGMVETGLLGDKVPTAAIGQIRGETGVGGRIFVSLTPPLVLGALAYSLFKIYG